MELLLILTYAAICVAIFKIFRIPVNKWTLPTAALGGLFLIGFILLVMNYNHPFTDNARVYFATTPIMPDVKGRVIEVPVKANATLKQDDVLFRVDPAPYQFEVEKRRAALAEAEQNVAQLKAGFDAAQATVKRGNSATRSGQGSYERYRQGNENARAGGRALALLAGRRGEPTHDISRCRRRPAGGDREGRASARRLPVPDWRRAYLGRASARRPSGTPSSILSRTTVRAPGPGFVTQLALRPGMYVIPAPLRPVMVFVHDDDRTLGRWFPAECLATSARWRRGRSRLRCRSGTRL